MYPKESSSSHDNLQGTLKMEHIPPEILTKVFWFARDDRSNFYDAQASPSVPSRVCRRWKEIAHSDPVLWSRVHMFNDSRDAHPAPE